MMTSLLPRSHEMVENSSSGQVVSSNTATTTANQTGTPDDVDSEKSERLNRASKKFLKACDQIKQIKKRIAELATMYNSIEKQQQQQQYRLELLNESSDQLSSSSSPPPSPSSSSVLSASSPTTTPTNVHNSPSSNFKFSINRFRETVRQQIENLLSIKSVYFIYANTKADEITRLQCELYGEDAVRMAYEMSSADPSSSSSGSHNSTSSHTRSSSTTRPETQASDRIESQFNDSYFMDTSSSSSSNTTPENESPASSNDQVDLLAAV